MDKVNYMIVDVAYSVSPKNDDVIYIASSSGSKNITESEKYYKYWLKLFCEISFTLTERKMDNPFVTEMIRILEKTFSYKKEGEQLNVAEEAIQVENIAEQIPPEQINNEERYGNSCWRKE